MTIQKLEPVALIIHQTIVANPDGAGLVIEQMMPDGTVSQWKAIEVQQHFITHHPKLKVPIIPGAVPFDDGQSIPIPSDGSQVSG